MTSIPLLAACATSTLGSLLLAGVIAAQPPAPVPANSSGGIGRIFAAALDSLGLVFKGIGSLSGGAMTGAVWCVDVRTGERRAIGDAADLAWPVPSPNGTTVYALRGRQVVGIAIADGHETPIGAPAGWRKLIGVLPDGTILGFVEDDPRPRPAMLAPDGGRSELPPPTEVAERQRNGVLLQEAHDYADGTRLEVRDSERGGRGRDVFLIDRTGPQKNLTDCGDDVCGQPSRSQDGFRIFYIRERRR
jgi:hypothetical protein